MSELNEKRAEKSYTDRVIEKPVDLFGYTPDEKSDENLKWMHEHGYLVIHKRVHHKHSGI